MIKRKKIGEATTTSTLLYVGDPAWEKPNAYDERLHRRAQEVKAGAVGVSGVVIPTGSDDNYPVYVTGNWNSPIKTLRRVVFEFTDDRVKNPGTTMKVALVGLLSLL